MNREDSKVLLKDIYQEIELPRDAPEGMEKYRQITWDRHNLRLGTEGGATKG